jgi:hypothetical protein
VSKNAATALVAEIKRHNDLARRFEKAERRIAMAREYVKKALDLLEGRVKP